MSLFSRYPLNFLRKNSALILDPDPSIRVEQVCDSLLNDAALTLFTFAGFFALFFFLARLRDSGCCITCSRSCSLGLRFGISAWLWFAVCRGVRVWPWCGIWGHSVIYDTLCRGILRSVGACSTCWTWFRDLIGVYAAFRGAIRIGGRIAIAQRVWCSVNLNIDFHRRLTAATRWRAPITAVRFTAAWIFSTTFWLFASLVNSYGSVSSGSNDCWATHLINDRDGASLVFEVEHVLHIEFLAPAAWLAIIGAAIVFAFRWLATLLLRLFILFATLLLFARFIAAIAFFFAPWLAWTII